MYIPETDYNAYVGKLAAACTVYPDLNDAGLQDSYHAMGADCLLKKMLTPGEYSDYLARIQEMNGFTVSFCILNTERFEWLIYDWGYGVELSGLYGKSMGLVKSKVKRRVTEALMQDDRITGVDGFSFIVSGRRLSLSFCVHTIFGDITETKEVSV